MDKKNMLKGDKGDIGNGLKIFKIYNKYDDLQYDKVLYNNLYEFALLIENTKLNGRLYLYLNKNEGNFGYEKRWKYISTINNNLVLGPKGDKGNMGNKGSMGIIGIKGEKGNIGLKGNKGNLGIQGLRGKLGLKGQKGDMGLKGNIGKQGNIGLKGIKGNVGNNFDIKVIWKSIIEAPNKNNSTIVKSHFINGDYGLLEGGELFKVIKKKWEYMGKIIDKNILKGDKGDIGFQGIEGIKGEKGSLGSKGIIGEIGPIGLIGNKGNKGDIGAGIQGMKGEKGIIGAKGNIGEKGIVGIKGRKGERGNIGKQGIIGLKGGIGMRGKIGDIGLKGNIGNQGLKGEIGNVGLKGEKGDIGDKGFIGQKGEIGNKGLKGEIGNKGLKGEIGNKGNNGNIGIQGYNINRGIYNFNNNYTIGDIVTYYESKWEARTNIYSNNKNNIINYDENNNILQGFIKEKFNINERNYESFLNFNKKNIDLNLRKSRKCVYYVTNNSLTTNSKEVNFIKYFSNITTIKNYEYFLYLKLDSNYNRKKCIITVYLNNQIIIETNNSKNRYEYLSKSINTSNKKFHLEIYVAGFLEFNYFTFKWIPIKLIKPINYNSLYLNNYRFNNLRILFYTLKTNYNINIEKSINYLNSDIIVINNIKKNQILLKELNMYRNYIVFFYSGNCILYNKILKKTIIKSNIFKDMIYFKFNLNDIFLNFINIKINEVLNINELNFINKLNDNKYTLILINSKKDIQNKNIQKIIILKNLKIYEHEDSIILVSNLLNNLLEKLNKILINNRLVRYLDFKFKYLNINNNIDISFSNNFINKTFNVNNNLILPFSYIIPKDGPGFNYEDNIAWNKIIKKGIKGNQGYNNFLTKEFILSQINFKKGCIYINEENSGLIKNNLNKIVVSLHDINNTNLLEWFNFNLYNLRYYKLELKLKNNKNKWIIFNINSFKLINSNYYEFNIKNIKQSDFTNLNNYFNNVFYLTFININKENYTLDYNCLNNNLLRLNNLNSIISVKYSARTFELNSIAFSLLSNKGKVFEIVLLINNKEVKFVNKLYISGTNLVSGIINIETSVIINAISDKIEIKLLKIGENQSGLNIYLRGTI